MRPYPVEEQGVILEGDGELALAISALHFARGKFQSPLDENVDLLIQRCESLFRLIPEVGQLDPAFSRAPHPYAFARPYDGIILSALEIAAAEHPDKLIADSTEDMIDEFNRYD